MNDNTITPADFDFSYFGDDDKFIRLVKFNTSKQGKQYMENACQQLFGHRNIKGFASDNRAWRILAYVFARRIGELYDAIDEVTGKVHD